MRVAREGVLPLSGLEPKRPKKVLDLKRLDSAPFDKNYVQNPMVIYERTLLCCGPHPDLEPGMWSAGLIKTLRFPTMVAGPHMQLRAKFDRGHPAYRKRLPRRAYVLRDLARSAIS
jgi:hypothetical protein